MGRAPFLLTSFSPRCTCKRTGRRGREPAAAPAWEYLFTRGAATSSPMHARVALRAGAPTDDHAIGIDDDGLAESELPDRHRHRVYGSIVPSRIARGELDVGEFP